MEWWHPEAFAEKRAYLRTRMALIKAMRGFFDRHDFYEVETPALQLCPAVDTHIHAFATDIKSVGLDVRGRLYLHTSPELAMKKLMVAGLPQLYQICHVFRNGDDSRLHSPEFTMLEWYRCHSGYRQIMKDCEELLRHCAEQCGITHYRHKGHDIDPFGEWDYITVSEAFTRYAGLDLESLLDDTDAFHAALKEQSIRTAADDRWDDLFFRVMAEKIEPFLGQDKPAILYEYPLCLASLARPVAERPAFAERFELYMGGLELANAFGELTNPQVQKERFQTEMAAKQTLYGETYPLDEELIRALAYGLPESGGIALGVDRLAMLASGAETIDQVLWTPKP